MAANFDRLDNVLATISIAETRAQGCEAGAKSLHAELARKIAEARKAGQPLPKKTLEDWANAIDSNVRHAQAARDRLRNARVELRALINELAL